MSKAGHVLTAHSRPHEAFSPWQGEPTAPRAEKDILHRRQVNRGTSFLHAFLLHYPSTHTRTHTHVHTCVHTCTCSHTYARPKLLELVLVWAELCQLDLSGKDVLQGERWEDKSTSYAQREKNESSRTQQHVQMQWWEPMMKGLGCLPKKYGLHLQHFKESSIGKLVTHSAFRIIETREERIDSRGI